VYERVAQCVPFSVSDGSAVAAVAVAVAAVAYDDACSAASR
jgi:hypothetical protein